uniref:Uncharacterized protein n=1 Tax=Octopus bimaculoides TaxID=37653 RepID=A0A0L8GP02_OCTBM
MIRGGKCSPLNLIKYSPLFEGKKLNSIKSKRKCFIFLLEYFRSFHLCYFTISVYSRNISFVGV